MNLTELSAALEAIWRLHGTGRAWDELARHLGENVDADATLWLLGRRREARAARLSFVDDELDALWRFLGYELHQLRISNESRASGHPDDAKENARRLAVTALAQSEVAGWYRADQDRRYGPMENRRTNVALTPDPGKSVPDSRDPRVALLARWGSR